MDGTILIISAVSSVLAAVFAAVPLISAWRNRPRVHIASLTVSRVNAGFWRVETKLINRSRSEDRILWIKVTTQGRQAEDIGPLPETAGQVILTPDVAILYGSFVDFYEEIEGAGNAFLQFERAGLKRHPFRLSQISTPASDNEAVASKS